MTLLDTLLGLTAFAFVSSITPGPNNLMLMASGMNFGFRRTIPHMLGVSGGFVLMVCLVGLGLAGLFEAYPAARTVLQVASIGYLLYLAYRIATAEGSADAPEAAGEDAKPFTFLQAALFQWVNPKAWTMALTAITVYASPADPIVGLALIALVFGAVNLPSVGLWAAAGTRLRLLLRNSARRRIFNVAIAALLVGSLYPVVFPSV
ncbi:LysE family translocator [Parasphingopyxis marina]|uniref:LysE family translocator n=1 Tax=Parasphingopyxis marina TaxID=2761622 RepID=A0A842HV55_9SPHN|nr:LysE family translocator [Parasphingopyxis marina]MBC2776317.1 LysE family translocator [Parasphingopyxis marina]